MPVYERVLAQLASFDLTEAEGVRVRSRVKSFLLKVGKEARN